MSNIQTALWANLCLIPPLVSLRNQLTTYKSPRCHSHSSTKARIHTHISLVFASLELVQIAINTILFNVFSLFSILHWYLFLIASVSESSWNYLSTILLWLTKLWTFWRCCWSQLPHYIYIYITQVSNFQVLDVSEKHGQNHLIIFCRPWKSHFSSHCNKLAYIKDCLLQCIQQERCRASTKLFIHWDDILVLTAGLIFLMRRLLQRLSWYFT